MSFVDIDAMVRTFLLAHVPVPVHVSVPKTRPAEFIVARRNGGAAGNRVVDFPTVTVDVWAASSVRASELAEAARTAFLHSSLDMPLVRGVEELTGPYSVPDPESGTARYRFSVRLTVRAQRT
ncbi:hypothetical protein [Microbacterium gubbeenense]|uniref:hypothetical protein n=1 Tax=Microbacterium gubbeenense TaxID=159896 RepID=UPI003F960356